MQAQAAVIYSMFNVHVLVGLKCSIVSMLKFQTQESVENNFLTKSRLSQSSSSGTLILRFFFSKTLANDGCGSKKAVPQLFRAMAIRLFIASLEQLQDCFGPFNVVWQDVGRFRSRHVQVQYCEVMVQQMTRPVCRKWFQALRSSTSDIAEQYHLKIGFQEWGGFHFRSVLSPITSSQNSATDAEI